MFLVPCLLALLLHDVVPDENRILVILRKDVERSAGKRKHLGMLLDEKLTHLFAEIGLRSLVGLINDDKIPVYLEHAAVLVELAARHLRTTQILYGREIDKASNRIIKIGKFPVVLRFDLAAEFVVGRKRRFAIECVAILFGKELIEVLLPSAADNRAVGHDDDAAEATLRLANDLKRGESLAEAHLGVPQHFGILFEARKRPLHRVHLLVSKFDWLFLLHFAAGYDRATVLYCRDGGLDGFEVRAEPLAPLCGADELVGNAGVLQDGVNFLVGEMLQHRNAVGEISEANGDFGVQERIFDAGGLSLLVDTGAGGIIQHLAIRRQLVWQQR